MPKWPVHIAMASKLNQTLNLGDNFVLGNVIPDIINGYNMPDDYKSLSHFVSHYKTREKEGNSLTSVESFIKSYQGQLNNPIVLGYLCHLLTDSFFNEYFYDNYTKTCGDEAFVTLRDGTTTRGNKVERAKIKQDDYDVYSNSLINNNCLGSPIVINDDTYSLARALKEKVISPADIDLTVANINDLINNKKIVNKSYKVFEQNELDYVFDECYQHIYVFLKRLNFK